MDLIAMSLKACCKGHPQFSLLLCSEIHFFSDLEKLHTNVCVLLNIHDTYITTQLLYFIIFIAVKGGL